MFLLEAGLAFYEVFYIALRCTFLQDLVEKLPKGHQKLRNKMYFTNIDKTFSTLTIFTKIFLSLHSSLFFSLICCQVT